MNAAEAIETHLRMIDFHVKQMSDCDAVDTYEMVLLELTCIRRILKDALGSTTATKGDAV